MGLTHIHLLPKFNNFLFKQFEYRVLLRIVLCTIHFNLQEGNVIDMMYFFIIKKEKQLHFLKKI